MRARYLAAGLAVTALAVAGAVFALVSHRPANAEQLARCVLAHADADTLYRWGLAGARDGALSPGRWAGMSCEAGWQMAVSKPLRVQVGTQLEVQGEVYDSPTFRSGIYEASVELAAPARTRQAARELGVWFEQRHAERRTAVACDHAQAEAVAFLEPLDVPFATAVLGVKGEIADPPLAQNTAMMLLARVVALGSHVPLESCQSARRESFLAQAREFEQFSRGQHPWAPGCGVALEGDDLMLRCAGASSAASSSPAPATASPAGPAPSTVTSH